MKPEDLLDPDKLPDDLQWLVAHQRLQPDDPVFLLVAWHWNRMKACEDAVRAATVELKAALDARIETLADSAEVVSGVSEALIEVQEALEEKPAALRQQFEEELRQPFGNAVAQLQAFERALAPAVRTFKSAQLRLLLASLLVGVTLGVLGATILLLA